MLFPYCGYKDNLLIISFRSCFLSFIFIAFFCFFEISLVKLIRVNTSIFFKVIKTKFLSLLFKNTFFINFLDYFTLITFTNDLSEFLNFIKNEETSFLRLFGFLFYQNFINVTSENLENLMSYFVKFSDLYDFIYYLFIKLTRTVSNLFVLNFTYGYLFTKKDIF